MNHVSRSADDPEVPVTVAVVRDWRALAACQGVEPEIFFPLPGEPDDKAREVCAACPVRVQCGDYALAAYEAHGVWGGMSETDRQRMRRRDQRAAARERKAAA